MPMFGNPLFSIYFAIQSTFMDSQDQSLETLQDIKRIMERSSRFISLSGLSGLSAGICALIGAYIAHGWLQNYAAGELELEPLKWKLVFLALSVLSLALASAFILPGAKQRKTICRYGIGVQGTSSSTCSYRWLPAAFL